MRAGLAFIGVCALVATASFESTQAEVVSEARVSLRYLWDRQAEGMLEMELAPAFERPSAESLIRLSGRIRLQSGELLDTKPLQDTFYSGISKPLDLGGSSTAELREAYWTWWRGAWQLTAGKQLLNWGRIDGFKILDAVNPQDFREFILDDFDSSRISTWGTLVEWNASRWHWQLFWSPDRTVHDLPDPGTAFEFRAPRLRFGSSFADSLAPFIVEEPSTDTAAMRVTITAEDWDFSVMALSGFDYEPIAGARDTDRVLSYPERRMIGAVFERALGQVVLRGEAAFRVDREVNTRTAAGLGIAVVDEISAAAALDYAGPWDVFASLQLIRNQILGGFPDLIRPRYDTLSTLYLRRSFGNERYTVDLRWFNGFEQHDGLLRFGLSYDNGGFVNLRVGFDYFYGNNRGLFGQYSDRERLFAKWQHTF